MSSLPSKSSSDLHDWGQPGIFCLKPPNMVGYIAFAMSRDRWNFSRNYENEMSIL